MTSFGSTQPFSFGTSTAAPSSVAATPFPSFGGATSAPTLFGGGTNVATTTSAPSLFGSTTSASTMFGGSTSTAATAPTLFGSTAASSTSSTLFGGTANKPTGAAAPFSFSVPQTTAASSMFGQPSTGLFGTSTTAQSNTFGFGTNQSKPNFSFGGTPATVPILTTFAQPQQQILPQQQPQMTLSPLQLLLKILHSPGRFPGDERDAIIAKWNQLQALCGTGKAMWSPDGQQELYQDLKPDNPFSKFKAVGYAYSPLLANLDTKVKESDGHLVFVLSKEAKEVQALGQQIVDGLHLMLTNKNPQFAWGFSDVETLPQGTTKMIIFCHRKDPTTGATAPIPAKDLQKEIEANQNLTNALKSQLGVVSIFPNVPTTKDGIKEQLENYLKTPPVGIDSLLWDQAKKDNPDPSQLIPVPLLGFDTLHGRLVQQEAQCGAHQSRLDAIANDINSLKSTESSTQSKMAQLKRNQLEMGHRLLKIMVKQEISRKTGMAITLDEEQLRTRLEALQTELNSPTQFKGRLNELLSNLRMHGGVGDVGSTASGSRLGLGDPVVMTQVKQLIAEQHSGIKALLAIVKEDLKDLKTMEDGWSAAAASPVVIPKTR